MESRWPATDPQHWQSAVAPLESVFSGAAPVRWAPPGVSVPSYAPPASYPPPGVVADQLTQPPVAYRPTYVVRVVPRMTVRAAAKQVGVAALLILLMIALGVAIIAIVGVSTHSGSSVILIPVGGGLVIIVGLLRGIIALLVALGRLVAAIMHRN